MKFLYKKKKSHEYSISIVGTIFDSSATFFSRIHKTISAIFFRDEMQNSIADVESASNGSDMPNGNILLRKTN